MLEIKVKADLKSQQKLARVMKEMIKHTRYTMPKVLRFAAKVYNSKATELTPKAKKKTWWFWDKHNKQWIRLKKKRELKIRGRGYAKQAWRESRKKIGFLKDSSKDYWSGGDVKSRAKGINKSGDRDKPYIMFASTVPYISILDRQKNILRKSLTHTIQKIEQNLTKYAKARVWRG